jgi:hypothetical protein
MQSYTGFLAVLCLRLSRRNEKPSRVICLPYSGCHNC